MFKKSFRIGLFLDHCRNTLWRFVRLLGDISGSVRTCLAYVWKKRRQTLGFMKSLLQFLKLVCDVIQKIRSLLFCEQTVNFV